GRALRERSGPIFGGLDDVDAYADAADRWFGELVAEGIAPDSMVTALERRAAGRIEEPPGIRGSTESNGSGGTSDGSRGTRTVPGPFSARRDAELIAAYRRYLELLVEAGLRDPRARLIDCSRAIRAQPEALAARLG